MVSFNTAKVKPVHCISTYIFGIALEDHILSVNSLKDNFCFHQIQWPLTSQTIQYIAKSYFNQYILIPYKLTCINLPKHSMVEGALSNDLEPSNTLTPTMTVFLCWLLDTSTLKPLIWNIHPILLIHYAMHKFHSYITNGPHHKHYSA